MAARGAAKTLATRALCRTLATPRFVHATASQVSPPSFLCPVFLLGHQEVLNFLMAKVVSPLLCPILLSLLSPPPPPPAPQPPSL